MAEVVSSTQRLPLHFSPQRFFLNAPKQRDGECYVLNSDFERAMAEIELLRKELQGYRDSVARVEKYGH